MKQNQTKTDNQNITQKKENTQEIENKSKNSFLSEESLSNNPFLAEGQTSTNPFVNPNQTSTNPFLPKDAKSVNPWINPSQVSTNPFLPAGAKSVNPFIPVQKKEKTDDIQLKEDTKNNTNSTASNKMSAETESKMSNFFGTDFSGVNIHKDSDKASELNAHAFTQGTDIHFAKGQYDEKSQQGQSLLGHELTHVVQQSEGKVQPTTQMKGVNINDDSALETEADQLGAKAASNNNLSIFANKSTKSIQAKANNQPVQMMSNEKAVGILSRLKAGTLPSSSDFDDATYEGFFTGSGTAKKEILSHLKWFESKNGFSEVIGLSASPISSYGIYPNRVRYQEALKRAITMQASVQAWLGDFDKNDKKQQDRAKRGAGMQAFLPIINNFVSNAEGSLRNTFGGRDRDEQAKEFAQGLQKDDKVQKIQQHYEKQPMKSVFQKLKPIVNMLAPAPESEGSVEAKVKFPVFEMGFVGAYIGGELKFGVERGETNTKIDCQIGLIFGAEAGFSAAKVGAEIKLGGYITSQAKTADEALSLVSYGLYQRLKESSFLGKYADDAWGGAKDASNFSKAVEEQVLAKGDATDEDENPYVELGGYVGGGVEAKAKLSDALKIGGEASIEHRRGKRYDKSTIGGKGKDVSSTSAEASGEIEIAGFGVKAGYSYDFDKKEHTVSLEGTTPALPGLGRFIRDGVIKIIGKTGDFIARKQKTEPGKERTDTLWTTVAGGLQQHLAPFADPEEDQVGDLKSGIQSEGKMGLKLEVNITKKEGSLSVTSDTTTEAAVEAGGAGFEFKKETSRKLITLAYEGGAWSLKQHLVNRK